MLERQTIIMKRDGNMGANKSRNIARSFKTSATSLARIEKKNKNKNE